MKKIPTIFMRNQENMKEILRTKNPVCDWVFNDCPRDFEGLREWLSDKHIEGIVFHHKDGRMAKIKKRDFQLER